MTVPEIGLTGYACARNRAHNALQGTLETLKRNQKETTPLCDITFYIFFHIFAILLESNFIMSIAVGA